jgi:hypothetical protein
MWDEDASHHSSTGDDIEKREETCVVIARTDRDSNEQSTENSFILNLVFIVFI